jgi:hypothetical protein
MHSGLATSNQPAEYGLQPANCGSCHTCSYWTRRLFWSESALNLPPWAPLLRPATLRASYLAASLRHWSAC